MAKRMADLFKPKTQALSQHEMTRAAQERAQMIEASQGGIYAGNQYEPVFDQPPVRPVKKG